MKTELTNRSRAYGYFIWPKGLDSEIKKLIPPETSKINVYFGEKFLGGKTVDWKYRRISLGYKYTKGLPQTAKVLIATRKRDGSLQIICQ